MGCDIHCFAEVRRDGKWVVFDEPVFNDYGNKKCAEPFGNRCYSVFGFLANVRNYSHCKPICEPKGLPDDSEYLNIRLEEPQQYSYYGWDNGTAYTKKGEIECDVNYHSLSFLTLKELLDFDYDATFWNRRITRQEAPNVWNGAAIANEGEGTTITYREHLGETFFADLAVLKTLGQPEDVRIIFWFDN